MSELKYWLGFNLVKGVGTAKQRALLTYFGTMENAWHAPAMQWEKVGLDRRAMKNLVETRAKLNLDVELKRVEDAGISLLTWRSDDYPSYLHEIPQSPPLLYLKGKLIKADRWAIAIVGTRRLTSYGRQITLELTRGLVSAGVTIVSGLARGIDSIAHKTAVEMGGRTIAVLGSGLDCLYPPENRKLADRIVENEQGVILSEYALGVQPEAKNFPPRNRVISGLSIGTIVIEAGAKSGALITSQFAVEQNRDVFAVPGQINSPASKGTNQLIQQGAKLVTCVDDILEELNINMVTERVAVQMALPDSAEEAALLQLLSEQPTHVDKLGRDAGLASAVVSSTLTLMELKGIVQQVGGMNYVLAREPEPLYKVSNPNE